MDLRLNAYSWDARLSGFNERTIRAFATFDRYAGALEAFSHYPQVWSHLDGDVVDIVLIPAAVIGVTSHCAPERKSVGPMWRAPCRAATDRAARPSPTVERVNQIIAFGQSRKHFKPIECVRLSCAIPTDEYRCVA